MKLGLSEAQQRRLDLRVRIERAAWRIFADVPTEVRIVVDGRPRALATGLCTDALRIVEEALTNARKYAAARRVTVELSYGCRQVRLAVHDDGVGFDAPDGGPYRRPRAGADPCALGSAGASGPL